MDQHHHDHVRDHSYLSDIDLRVRARDSILVEKCYYDPSYIYALAESD